MEHHMSETIMLLERTPPALDAMLRGLPLFWIRNDEGEGTMTVFDVVGHLLHAERTNFVPRAKLLLEKGEAQQFAAFDRWGHRRDAEGKALETLLDEFSAARSANLAELRSWNLQPRDLERRGLHPARGSVTLAQLLATWAVHDLTHLHQISRVLAHQYREHVGPMAPFLGVLRCEGHSAPA